MVREPIGWTGENLRKQNIEKLHPDSGTHGPHFLLNLSIT
jgi:hypothetical protein